MEQEELLPRARIPPHGRSNAEAIPSDSTSDFQRKMEIAPSNDDQVGYSSLENKAIELYGEILLSRAHFLFFNSIRDDVDVQEELFLEGKKVLEEAESLCMSGQFSVSNKLVAKCWYIRGFLADVCGDNDNALRCFKQAKNLDETYISLKRVNWHLQREENLQELFGQWGETIQTSERGNIHYRLGDPDSSDEDAWPTSSDSQDSRNSVLYKFLLSHTKTPLTETLLKDAVLPTSSPLHHSHPIANPRSAKINLPVKKQVDDSGVPRRASRETLRALKETENSPDKDPFFVLVEESKKRASREAEERLSRLREEKERQFITPSAAQLRRPSSQEALLSDTPSITELDTTFTMAKRSAASPTLTVNTHGLRKLSLSRKSSALSPASPSPLRKESLPGDVEEPANQSFG